jgi:SAM-dependent methyltransferase
LEAAGIAAGSVDVIISNCVINLSPDKPAVLREAYRALADGGEVFFSGGWLLGHLLAVLIWWHVQLAAASTIASTDAYCIRHCL